MQTGILGGAFADSWLLYSLLPQRVPTHFDFAGGANGWTEKPFGELQNHGVCIQTKRLVES
jgi:uncharacterized membrane protein